MKNGYYQYEIVEQLSFVRYGGTENELKAARMILAETEKMGGEASIMDFTVPAFEIHRCSMAVSAPYEKPIPCAPFGLGGDFSEGVELRPYYAARGVEDDYIGIDSLEGFLVMLDKPTPEAYKLLIEKHASAFAIIQGKHYDPHAAENLYLRPLRPKFLKHGRLPGFVITAADATDIIRSGAERIRIETSFTETAHTSRNVIAFIPGSEIHSEEVVVTAHYDSVPVGSGSWDNATGSATILWLYKHFLENPPRRDMRFIWCGSEEQGLLGARAFIESNPQEVEKIKFCFNFDMCGTVLGANTLFVTGKEDLVSYARQYCREVGFSAEISKTVHSSDSAPFADKGIPAIGISRRDNTAEIHTVHDTMAPLCPKSLAATADFAVGMMERVINSALLPTDPGMPDDLVEVLNNRFRG